jgi:hypothetical protein
VVERSVCLTKNTFGCFEQIELEIYMTAQEVVAAALPLVWV